MEYYDITLRLSARLKETLEIVRDTLGEKTIEDTIIRILVEFLLDVSDQLDNPSYLS